MLPTMDQIRENKMEEDEIFIAASNTKYPSIFSHNSIPTDLSRSASMIMQVDEEAKRYETPLRSERNVVDDLKLRIERNKRELTLQGKFPTKEEAQILQQSNDMRST